MFSGNRWEGRMTTYRMATAVIALLVGVSLSHRSHAQPAPLALEGRIALNDTQGRIDHMAVDIGRKRLFVAELGNGTVDVIDLAMGTVIRRLAGLKKPQGLAFAPGADELAVASAGDGTVRLFRGPQLAPAGVVGLGDDADDARIDARTGDFVIGYGSGGLAVIDPAGGAVAMRVPLPVHPEGFQLDPARRMAAVNLPDARRIAVIDMAAGRATGEWRLPAGVGANFPMALDPSHSQAAVVFRRPARLVLFNTETGKQEGVFTSCGDADDVFYDPKRDRIYVSCGEGRVDAWQQDGASVRALASLRTSPGARTSLFVPELDRLYVAAPAGVLGGRRNAAILVLRPAD